ncbi:MAG: hypothetical protein QG559_1154 [Campylobacterota bacterium]|nr:hypothetical protein [Campylobacterota bacterium]
MIYKTKIGDIDLSRVIRLYPAVVIELDGDIAEMSLEWAEMNGEKVKINSYVLVFDFTQSGEKSRDKKELHFDSRDELIFAMQEVAQFFQD